MPEVRDRPPPIRGPPRVARPLQERREARRRTRRPAMERGVAARRIEGTSLDAAFDGDVCEARVVHAPDPGLVDDADDAGRRGPAKASTLLTRASPGWWVTPQITTTPRGSSYARSPHTRRPSPPRHPTPWVLIHSDFTIDMVIGTHSCPSLRHPTVVRACRKAGMRPPTSTQRTSACSHSLKKIARIPSRRWVRGLFDQFGTPG